MKKIISLFQRNYDGDRLVRDEIVPGAEWVVEGLGVATRKWDGTCCLVKDGQLYKRYDAKQGRTPPEGFIPAQEPDPVTGHWPGWLLVGDGPQDRWHREAFQALKDELGEDSPDDWTYELCGPRVQSNPEGFDSHVLLLHGMDLYTDCPRDFEGIKNYLAAHDIEGIVFWRNLSDPDCDKVKIKAKDFGFKRGNNA